MSAIQDILLLTALLIILAMVLQAWHQWWQAYSYDLNGKTILLTGGSRGLGLVMARQLVQAGARLAICARDADELERARAELTQAGGEAIAIPCDVTDRTQVDSLVQQVRDRLGRIDVLINNAGIDIVGPMEVMTMQDYDDTMKLHFWAPLYTTYAVLPEMQQRKTGRIVNIASIGGKIVFPHMLAYCASKFALVGLSEGMQAELAKDGISVTTICPGTIRTGVLRHVPFKGQHRQEFTWFSLADSLPLISVSAEQVARQTIAAFRRGQAEVIMPLHILITAKFYALFPGLSASLLGGVNRSLPSAGGIGTARAEGKDSRPAWLPAWILGLNRRAEERNNELGHQELRDPEQAHNGHSQKGDRFF